MKRLINISINIAIGSITPIVIWFILGTTIDKDLVNIFELTYPLQFVYQTLLSNL